MSKNEMSRRKFLGLTGGVLGAAALGSMAFSGDGWSEEKPSFDVGDMESEDVEVDVLVIGSGMAGLFAAVKAHDAGAKVMMVSKGRLGSSGQTPFAKGIFVYDAATAEYSLDEYVDAVSYSAMGTNNPIYTRQVAEHSKARVQELREWGFFDSPLYHKAFSKPIRERNIPVIERVTITHLIKEDEKMVGAAGFSIDEAKTYFFNAKSVVLCTGAGGFKPNGFPICDLTHDGTVMAYNIGAKVTGKEWNDGHPGRAKNAAACFDGWGDMFLQKPNTVGVGIRHDLGVDMNYMAYMSGGAAKMGPPGDGASKQVAGGPYRPEGIGGENTRGHERSHPQNKRPERDSPAGDRPEGGRAAGAREKEGERKGPPPGMGGNPVGGASAGMAIHKSEGLVPINDQCESNITGLFAAGDALGSYMSGAIYTQIGSSLAGSAVQGAIAGEAAAVYSNGIQGLSVSAKKKKDITSEIQAPLQRTSGYSPAWVTQTLQGIMIPNFVLYIKKESLMRAALAYVEELRDHHLPMLKANDLHELRLAHETANMVISAEMKLKASLMRTESRCSHYRLDYPEVDHQNWEAWINIYKGEDGSMQLEKQPFKA